MASSTSWDRDSSLELGSASMKTQYHEKTGRPIRRGAGRVKAVAGYVDSVIIEEEYDDDETLVEMPPEDEDGQIVKPQRKRRRSPSPATPPLDPIIRDVELDVRPSDDEEDSFQRKDSMPPATLQFNVPLGFHGPLMVKLDRSLLLQDGAEGAAHDMMPRRNKRKKKFLRRAGVEKIQAIRGKTWADIPAELRNKVYRYLFVDDIVTFPPKRPLDRTATFLRTCRLVHSEGCSILYGENTFNFDRIKYTRGAFWESTPKEIGYTDVRRFLGMIGSENLAYLRDVKLVLEDACPSSTPYLDHEQRRYINDEHLIDCLRILRAAKLRTFTLTFLGRRSLIRLDVKFLGYLEQIKADEVLNKNNPPHWHYPNKVSTGVFIALQETMERKKKLYVKK